MQQQTSTIQVIYNEKCSKCRGSKSLLEEILQKHPQHNIQYLNYLEQNTLTKQKIQEIQQKLNIEDLRLIMRKGEKTYKDLDLDNESVSQEKLLQSILENPILLERPIVLYQEQAVVARPPEKLLELFEAEQQKQQ